MKLLLLFALCVHSLHTFAQTRQDRATEASKAFLNLNFFYKGRGMSVSPDMIKTYEYLRKFGIGTSEQGPLQQRWGMIPLNNKVQGLFNEPYEGMQVGVLGCVACHSGKAAGHYVVGLGNKNIDVGQIGADAVMAMKMWGALPHSNPKFKELHERSLSFTKGLSDPKITNHTQGLVPTSFIRSWFYKVKGEPIPQDFLKGLVKVPHLWGYGEKKKSGLTWGGEGNGDLGGWIPAIELSAGQSVENVREYFGEKVKHTEEIFEAFLPPKYPFSVNSAKAANGEKIFVKSCQGCHGTYLRDLEGQPIYDSPKLVPLRIVKTDSDRLDAMNDDLIQHIDSNPLNEYIQVWKHAEPGYVAPKLWGIWARFPYLHNMSVPTVYDLLSAPETRPKQFSLKNAGEKERFDQERLGLTIIKKDLWKRRLYDTTRKGSSNQGHYFESFKTLTHENKLELIEYLKTL